MVMVNVWQAGVPTPLLAHTVVGPYVPAWVAVPVMNPWGVSDSPGGSAPAVTENVGDGVRPVAVNWCR